MIDTDFLRVYISVGHSVIHSSCFHGSLGVRQPSCATVQSVLIKGPIDLETPSPTTSFSLLRHACPTTNPTLGSQHQFLRRDWDS